MRDHTAFRTRLDEGPVYGVFAKTNDPFFIEVLGHSGFDFVILDNEHGPNGPRDLYPLLLAAEASGLSPIVRVGVNSAIEIQRVMDLGVAGVQIPQIQSGADARAAVDFSHYHPIGMRGLCRFVRAADFSMREKGAYFDEQNRLVTIVHVEGTEGVEAFEEIVAVEGIDVIFIGPYDLSQSLGLPGQVSHPKVASAVEDLVRRCRERKKHAGIFVESVDAAHRYRDLGVSYIAYSVDVGLFADRCREVVAGLHGR